MFSVCFNKLTSVYPSKTNHYSVHLFIINRIYRFGILLIFHFYPFPFRKKKRGGGVIIFGIITLGQVGLGYIEVLKVESNRTG